VVAARAVEATIEVTTATAGHVALLGTASRATV
jgi:hypothetical protein